MSCSPLLSLCAVSCEKIQLPKGVDGRRREWNYSDPRPASLRGRRPPSAREGRKEGRFALLCGAGGRRRPSCPRARAPLLAISNARGESSSKKVPNGRGQTVWPSVRYFGLRPFWRFGRNTYFRLKQPFSAKILCSRQIFSAKRGCFI